MSDPLRVLLIEDNRGDADLTRELIKDTGIVHEIIWVDDGEKAIEFFQGGENVDLIIVDLKLPRVSGHEIMKFLRGQDNYATTPAVILTGSDSPSDQEIARKNGVVCYLIKPMTLWEMERTTSALKEILLGQRSCGCWADPSSEATGSDVR
jgi:CheY-like chemotaxis protein